jgi:DNA glycosylase AlkZ-like
VRRSSLELTQAQILAFRRRVGALDERLPRGARSLRRAAWAGLTDSVPRAALLSIHARVEGTRASSWEDRSLVQVWGPRYSVYVVAAQDRAVFTLGRMPDDARRRARAEDMAARVHALLGDRQMKDNDAQHALGVGNAIKYATTTGTVLIRWDGARAPLIWTAPAPEIDPLEARRELARRYLHVSGPATPEGFALWAGVPEVAARVTFDALRTSLTPVGTPIGDAWILARDEPVMREPAGPTAAARLLPSGDTYYLFWGSGRELLVPDAARRAELWTSRVWPAPSSSAARSPARGVEPSTS